MVFKIPRDLSWINFTGPLGLWPFFHSRDSVGHSSPLGPGLSSLFSSLLSPLPFTTALTQLVIPAHSVFGFLHLSLPPSLISTFFHSLDSVGHSGPLSLWLPLYLFLLLFSWFLHHRLDSVGHSGPLGLWQLPLSFLLPPYSLFFTLACTQSVIPAHSVPGYLPPLVLFSFPRAPSSHGHNPVGHSGPLGYWLHLALPTSFLLTLLFTPHPTPSLPCRSFRPTRQLTSSPS